MTEELVRQVPGIVEVTLVPGVGGVFRITAGDKLVYDIARSGQFPRPGESARLVQG